MKTAVDSQVRAALTQALLRSAQRYSFICFLEGSQGALQAILKIFDT